MVAGSSEWVCPQSGEVDKNALPVYFCAAASQTPTTAIAYDDPRFVDWASGWKDVYYGENCADEWRTPHLACGKAGTSVFDTVCLGDGGSITMTFDNAIRDGEGFDFAVFENSFDEKFLELAYVEVSSDGVNFVRFPNLSFMIPGFEDFEYGEASYESAVEAGFIRGVEEAEISFQTDDTGNVVYQEGGIVTLSGLVSASTAHIEISFLWGEKFNGENPYKIFKDYTEESDRLYVAETLSYIGACLKDVTYVISFTRVAVED